MLHPKFRIGYTYSIHKVITQVVPSGLKSLKHPVPSKKTITLSPPHKQLMTPFTLMTHSFIGQIHFPIRIPCAISGPGVTTQYRFGHTDLPWPDFTEYRRDSCKSNMKTNNTEERKLMTYVAASVGFTCGLYGTKAVLIHYIAFMAASAEVLALAKIEVKLSDIPEGTVKTLKWRGKPLIVAHRTPADIKRERSVDIKTLRDPEEDIDRVQNESWLVVLGVCTHLGCVPMPYAGDYFGYYCPCHGSHFDASGRTRKGPAPTNLEVPVYTFTDPDTIVVG